MTIKQLMALGVRNVLDPVQGIVKYLKHRRVSSNTDLQELGSELLVSDYH